MGRNLGHHMNDHMPIQGVGKYLLYANAISHLAHIKLIAHIQCGRNLLHPRPGAADA